MSIYIPYFYVIEENSTGMLYAGSKWARDANPDNFMIKEGGYITSSNTIKLRIRENGIESFKIRKIKTFISPKSAYDYETKFLNKVNAKKNSRFYNKHNNDKITPGTYEFENIMLEKCNLVMIGTDNKSVYQGQPVFGVGNYLFPSRETKDIGSLKAQHLYVTSVETPKDGDVCMVAENHLNTLNILFTSTEEITAQWRKIILTTNTDLIKELSRKVGSQSVVASIDAIRSGDNYQCKIFDGTQLVNISPVDLAIEAQNNGCGEVIINSIDRDGTMVGYDLELIHSVSSNVQIPTVACGGAKDLSDLQKAITLGKADAVAAGSMFVYYGKLKAVLITYPSNIIIR
jgi:hypothetical protein